MKKLRFILGAGVGVALSLYTFTQFQNSHFSKNLTDQALLSIIKNDQHSFKSYLAKGGTLDSSLNLEGQSYKIGELLVKYQRISLIKLVSEINLPISFGDSADSDMWTMAIPQNNPDLFQALMDTNPDYKLNSKSYGKEGRNLLHLASVQCSHKLLGLLQASGMNWNDKDKTGATALTLAARHDCLQALSFWKERSADFRAIDGRGESALSILRKKQDSALVAFADSFEEKTQTVVVAHSSPAKVPNFYKKRTNPRDRVVNRSHLLEPADRPDDANESSEYSEFSD
jgi:hypothetical protein